MIRRHDVRVRQPGQTASLILFEDLPPSDASPSFPTTGASSMQTLVAPDPTDTPILIDRQSDDIVCSHCLKTLASGILDLAMNLITSHTSPSPQTMQKVRTLASCLHSYISGHIVSIHKRTSLTADVLVNGLAKLALNETSGPPIVRTLIENAVAEVCGQILEELGLAKCNNVDTTTTHMVNGLATDWFNSLSERTDLKWMLPGYIASCLVIYQLSESGFSKVADFDESPSVSLMNGNFHGSQIDDILEALSIILIHSVRQANEEYYPQR